MKIFIAGANGSIGQILVGKLVERGHEVAAMVRKESQLDDLRKVGAHPILADLTDRESLDTAVRGQELVIFVAGSKGKALESVDRDGAIHLCDATKNAGIVRFILLSSIFAGRPQQGPEKLQPYLKAKQVADEYVQKSGLDYTILRPGALTDAVGTGAINIGDSFEGPGAQISRTDVAEVIAASLVEPKTVGAVFEFIEGNTPIAQALSQLE
ncbi:SDR family oxidoreductase [Microbulbifer sp. OS29]|uniref:SDR family oxidoreductase n=1 Tax=Microbulbifer okhotskensis TaxID=2926617 RepID=A0A9X2J924_9GAMM|nr:SDR family oxidoreductase [Microbulbifer okhotskensis]MCO1336181.1 SDR family oxidoreductase [Microbulbifer okhotskensis]